MSGPSTFAPLSDAELARVFAQKYGPEATLGWGPRQRRRFGYHNPDDHYEAAVARLVGSSTRWLDVGCGREVFPSNRPLASELAARCARLVGVDPDPTIAENPFVHEGVQLAFEAFDGARGFDLITLRMVAEHVTEPEPVVAALARAAAPGAHAEIYTVDAASPVPLLTRLAPMGLRHRVKRWLWRTEEKDTFPTAFQMNSRRRLRTLLEDGGFAEVGFFWLDDCRTFGRFRSLNWGELALRRALRAIGLRYPERCLLGVYRSATAGQA